MLNRASSGTYFLQLFDPRRVWTCSLATTAGGRKQRHYFRHGMPHFTSTGRPRLAPFASCLTATATKRVADEPNPDSGSFIGFTRNPATLASAIPARMEPVKPVATEERRLLFSACRGRFTSEMCQGIDFHGSDLRRLHRLVDRRKIGVRSDGGCPAPPASVGFSSVMSCPEPEAAHGNRRNAANRNLLDDIGLQVLL